MEISDIDKEMLKILAKPEKVEQLIKYVETLVNYSYNQGKIENLNKEIENIIKKGKNV